MPCNCPTGTGVENLTGCPLLSDVVRAVVLRELRLHRLPVNLLGQKDQLVVHVNETLQCDFKDGHLMLLGGGPIILLQLFAGF